MYPLIFLCDFDGSVQDTEIGELLKYINLIEHPKLKEEWKCSFGNKIGRLAQSMQGKDIGTKNHVFGPEAPNTKQQIEQHCSFKNNV